MVWRLNNIDTFIAESRKLRGDKYDYSMVEYLSPNKQVKIICPIHGEFFQTPYNHTHIKTGCPKCDNYSAGKITKDYVDSRLSITHPGWEIITEYKRSRDSVIIIDGNGVRYKSNINSLLSGRVPTMNSCLDKNKLFSIKAKAVHGDKFLYDKVEYKNVKSKVIITCPIHGDFKQFAHGHLNGSGCRKCADIESTHRIINSESIWNLSGWIRVAERSPNFDSYKVYIIRCFGNGEEFVKIGRTFCSLENRFDRHKSMTYNRELICEIKDSAYRVFKLELLLKRKCKEFRYIPKIKFGGMYECFTLDCLNLIKEYIDDNA